MKFNIIVQDFFFFIVASFFKISASTDFCLFGKKFRKLVFSSFVKKETFRGQKDFLGDLKLD